MLRPVPKRPILLSAVAALGLVAAGIAGSAAASTATYTATNGSIGLSASDAWQASSAGVAAVVDDAGDKVLALTGSTGNGNSVTHDFATNAYPALDNVLPTRLPALNLFSGATNGQIDPATGLELQPSGEATVEVRTDSGSAQLYVDLNVMYGEDDDSLQTVVLSCEVPVGSTWSNISINDCSGLGQTVDNPYDAMSWKPSTTWTFVPSWGGAPVTIPAGTYVKAGSSPAVMFASGFSFRAVSSTGAAVHIDNLEIRGQSIDFAAATTTSFLGSAAAILGTDATISANVTPSNAVGSIAIFEGGTKLGEGDAASGSFTLSTSALAAGAHSLTAVFTPVNSADFTASTSPVAVLTVNAKDDTPAPAPATDTAGLEQFIQSEGLDVAATTASFSAPVTGLDPADPITGTLPWADTTDSFVDVYGYSTPTYLGTFPVVGGVVQLNGLDVSALTAGGHHLVFIGQTSNSVQVMLVTLADTLAATGADIVAPVIAGSLLLIAGIAALLTVRRRRSA